jgi:hypothetical protein
MRTCLAILTFALPLLPRDAGAEPPLDGVEIMVLADYGDDQLPAHFRRDWWAICPGEPAHLQRVTVSGREVPNEIGKTIRTAAKPCADAPLLLRAKSGLGDREVATAKVTRSGPGAFELTRGEQRLALRLTGKLDGDQWLEVTAPDRPRQRIRVTRFGPDWHAEQLDVLWAGDLDGDGALDFAVRASGDGDDVRLFLSSRARAGHAVGEAASTFFGGC